MATKTTNNNGASFWSINLKDKDVQDATTFTLVAMLYGGVLAAIDAWHHRKEYVAEKLRQFNIAPNTLYGLHKTQALIANYLMLKTFKGALRFGFLVAGVTGCELLLARKRQRQDLWNPTVAGSVVGFVYGLPFGLRKSAYSMALGAICAFIYGLIQYGRRRYLEPLLTSQKTESQLEGKSSTQH
jgi:hypothetical protein